MKMFGLVYDATCHFKKTKFMMPHVNTKKRENYFYIKTWNRS